MKTTHVILSMIDLNDMTDLLGQHSKYFGEETNLGERASLLAQHLTDSKWVFHGSRTDEGKLLAFIGQRNAADSPTWLASWAVMAPADSGMSFEATGYVELLNQAVIMGERTNRTAFFAGHLATDAPTRIKRVQRIVAKADAHRLKDYVPHIWWTGKIDGTAPPAVRYILWSVTDKSKEYTVVQWVKPATAESLSDAGSGSETDTTEATPSPAVTPVQSEGGVSVERSKGKIVTRGKRRK